MLNVSEEQFKDINQVKALKIFSATKILPVISSNILELKKQGFNIKDINHFVNNECGVKIEYISFYKWFKKNIDSKKVALKSESKKTSEGETVSQSEEKEINKGGIMNNPFGDLMMEDD